MGEIHTKRKKKIHAVQYLLGKKIESMNIALIVHFTPQTLRRPEGRGLCSVEQ